MSGPTGEYTGWRHIILYGVDLTGRALGLEVVADLLAKEVLLQGGCAAGRRIRNKTNNIRSKKEMKTTKNRGSLTSLLIVLLTPSYIQPVPRIMVPLLPTLLGWSLVDMAVGLCCDSEI